MKKHQVILDVIFFLYPVSLGEVERLFNKHKSYDKVISELEGLGTDKVAKDPKQIDLVDMINEVENEPKTNQL